MCKWGTDVELLVPMPAELSHTGEFRWAVKGIDACIAPLVQALNDAGLYTSNCCCGHGKAPGIIALHDGRAIVIYPSLEIAQVHAVEYVDPYPLNTPDELFDKLVQYLAEKFEAPAADVQRWLNTQGLPVLADATTITVLNPGKYIELFDDIGDEFGEGEFE